MMKRKGKLFDILVSDKNLSLAIDEVNKSHHYIGRGNLRRVNQTTVWVEATKPDRIKELRQIILNGFVPKPMRRFMVYDANARKWREIFEPAQYPDQYIHHALQQVLEPVMMRGMDFFCCGSIRKRGAKRGIKFIKKWMKTDKRGTRNAIECDIKRFYNNIDPKIAFAWFKRKVKDRRVLDLIWTIIKDGVTIGGFFSQWVANSMLQPIDMKIRQSGLCDHYVKYIDNFTIFGRNKKKLKKLLLLIEEWLGELGLWLKENKQIFRVDLRMVSALGFRFNHVRTYLRKYNLLGIRRKVRRLLAKIKEKRNICAHESSSILSKLGQLKHCDSHHLRRDLYGKGFIKRMKTIVRIKSKRKGKRKTWSYTLLQAKMQLASCA